MTLEEFVKELRGHIVAFESDFRKNQKENPDYYPKDMALGQWYEQFQLFEEEDND